LEFPFNLFMAARVYKALLAARSSIGEMIFQLAQAKKNPVPLKAEPG